MSYDVDLLPDDYYVVRMAVRRFSGWAVATAGGLAVVAIVALTLDGRLTPVEGQIDDLRARVESMAVHDARLPSIEERLQAQLRKLELASALRTEPKWNVLLADLANATGESLRVTNVAIGRLPDPESLSEVGPAQLRLTGIAKTNMDVLAFMRAFAKSPAVTNLTLEMSGTNGTRDGQLHSVFEIAGRAVTVAPEEVAK